jgi:PAT family beta-lactamase induction signal transducer AmpG
MDVAGPAKSVSQLDAALYFLPSDTLSLMPPATDIRRSPAWLVGITYLPFGLYSGFIIVSLQLLLTARGLAVDHIALLQLISLIPSYSSFLLTPLADCGLPRRTWAVLFAAIAAACLAAGSLLMDKAVTGDAIPLALTLLVGMFAAQLYSSTMGGITPSLIDEADTGAVSAWLNVANLGGTGLGGTLGILIVQHLTRPTAAIALAAEVFTPCLLLFVMTREVRTPYAVRSMLSLQIFRDMWAVSRNRAALIGFLIFVIPAATFAAQNLFSGLGRDFHASDNQVTWIVGIGNAITCSLGAFVGGWLCNRMDRRILFVLTGVVSATATLGMAFGSRTATVFLAGVTLYNLLAGINYAAASAVAFDIMGIQNPLAATQYAMLMAACNVAISTVIWGDSRGYKLHGATGALVADASFSLITGTVMLTVIKLYGGSGKRSVAALEPAEAL